MSTQSTLEIIRSRIQSRFPLLFLATWEEDRWETELASLALSLERGLVVWTSTQGACPPLDGATDMTRDAAEFLDDIRRYPRDHVFLLKDFHPALRDPFIVRRLRDLIPTLADENKTLVLMSPDPEIPLDLRKDAIRIDLPLPGLDDLQIELRELLIERQHAGEPSLKLSSKHKEKLLKAVVGLTARQARQSLSRALKGRTTVDDEVFALLVSEKRQMVQGSELLEFYDLAEGVGDIGGLDALKDWLAKRSQAFSLEAQQKGIPAPKGVLLLGVQGCGKSLTSRAIARLLSLPLVRLDVSSLLSSDRGQSEKNLRDVLTLTEMIAPVVLWLDEVEKGFAGADSESGGDATMIRLMGRFLTWMQEKPASVFIVATANSVAGLPPEMLRRGRFDELFFVDLPNFHERKQIFVIHLRKRGFSPESFDLLRLSEMTEGYSGAEIEQAVLAAMVEGFHRGQQPQQQELKQAVEEIVPLSVTMEEKIFQLREWARPRCRAATPDSRVLQMLEAEQRLKTGEESVGLLSLLEADARDETPSGWEVTAREGALQAALFEYVVEKGSVTFDRLLKDFESVVDLAGEFGIALRSDPHVILWMGLQTDAAIALTRLLTDRKLYVVVHTNSATGESPARLPKLPTMPADRVSRPCWLPCVLTATTPESVDERLTRVARMKLNR